MNSCRNKEKRNVQRDPEEERERQLDVEEEKRIAVHNE